MAFIYLLCVHVLFENTNEITYVRLFVFLSNKHYVAPSNNNYNNKYNWKLSKEQVTLRDQSSKTCSDSRVSHEYLFCF